MEQSQDPAVTPMRAKESINSRLKRSQGLNLIKQRTSDTSAIAGFPRSSDVPVKSNISSII